ncbi:radical SAM domain-containing protein [Klebsiella pneumoniae]|uniref:Radical SAM domain-containing protein n=1 Tax=Klebsiella pneumoniae TaxID=573 RepID=A0A377WSJ9_KLEPN|nr:radical SAM domain-containing protein [Klebsiella pneumoniae]
MSTTRASGWLSAAACWKRRVFRVGIISQPDWNSKDDFMRLGKPNLFFGVTAGNMDSMINRYTRRP